MDQGGPNRKMNEIKKSILILGASSDIGIETIKQISKVNIESRPAILAHVNRGKNYLIEQLIPCLSNEQFSNIRIIEANFQNPLAVKNLLSEINGLGLIPDSILHLACPKIRIHRFKEFEIDALQQINLVQIDSFIKILNDLLPKMLSTHKISRLIFLISSAVLNDSPKYMSEYVVGKYAQLGLFKALVSEYRDRKIRINAVSPGMIETKFLSNVPIHFKEMVGSQQSERRLHTVEEVVPSILFFLSKGGDNIHGENVEDITKYIVAHDI